MSFQYGYLKGTIRSVVGDAPGDGDHFPDIVHIPGLKAKVAPHPPRLTDSAAKITYFTAPIDLGFDNAGVLRLLHHIDGLGNATEDAVSEIPLIAQDDDDLNPSGGWTYQITITAPSIPTWTFSFQVNTGEVHDLSEIAPVAQSPGVITTRGPDGRSAYELAVEQGFEGSLEDYLVSLHGEDGAASVSRGTATDLNVLVGGAAAGSWQMNSGTLDKPDSESGNVMVVSDSSYTSQIVTTYPSGRTWSRQWSGVASAWTPWVRLDEPDTGWRDITGNVASGALSPSNAGRLLVRRTRDRLIYRLDKLLLAPGSGTLDIIGSGLPTLWRPSGRIAAQVGTDPQAYDLSTIVAYSWALSWRFRHTTTGAVTQDRPTWALDGEISTHTDASFPTAPHPGTPA